MRWRLIRAFQGSYGSPAWQRVYQYDAGHGGLVSVTNRRGITTTFMWTPNSTYGWRVTKVKKLAPWSYPWANLDIELQYQATTGFLERIIWPLTAVVQDADENGSLESSVNLNRIRVFEYDSSKRLIGVYEDLDGPGGNLNQGLRRLLAFEYVGTAGKDFWRVKKQHLGPVSKQITYSFSYGVETEGREWTQVTDPLTNLTQFWGRQPRWHHVLQF